MSFIQLAMALIRLTNDAARQFLPVLTTLLRATYG